MVVPAIRQLQSPMRFEVVTRRDGIEGVKLLGIAGPELLALPPANGNRRVWRIECNHRVCGRKGSRTAAGAIVPTKREVPEMFRQRMVNCDVNAHPRSR
jgi:hypothetical protein